MIDTLLNIVLISEGAIFLPVHKNYLLAPDGRGLRRDVSRTVKVRGDDVHLNFIVRW